ncbi:MAG: hypothetical protein ACQESF_06425 [Nanobdellota archaeon]
MGLDNVILGIDASSGDLGSGFDLNTSTANWVEASALALNQIPDLEIALYGDKDLILKNMKENSMTDRVEIIPAQYHFDMQGVVQPSEKRLDKGRTTYWKALEDLKSGLVSGVVSATSTDTMVIYSNKALGSHPYREHVKCSPPLLVSLPNNKGGNNLLLDCGSNKTKKESFMSMFAVMGITYSEVFFEKENPKLGLLSIGTEEKKASPFLSGVNKDFENMFPSQYNGYIEPNGSDGLFENSTDVMVVDGITGNYILKTLEATTSFLINQFKDNVKNPAGNYFSMNARRLSNLAGCFFLSGAFNSLKQRIDPQKYNGAPLLGARGSIFKAHGSSDSVSLSNAIANAYSSVKRKDHERFNQKLNYNLKDYF